MLHDKERKGLRALDVGKSTEHKAVDFADVLYPCPTFFIGVGAHAITATGDVELGNPTLGIVASGLVDFFEIEGADAVVAFAIVGGCPGVETCVADLAGGSLHLLGSGDSGGEGLGSKTAENGGFFDFGLLLEGEEERLIHLLLADESAAVLTLVAGLELGGNSALDGVGGYVL